MARERASKHAETEGEETETEKVWPDRHNLPQNPLSRNGSQWPLNEKSLEPGITNPFSPQTIGINFTGATLSGTNPTGAFPPDDMGAVGPTQYIIAVNGRIVSFSKTTGVAGT